MPPRSNSPTDLEIRLEPIAALIANVLTIGTLLYAWLLLQNDADRYYRAVQEDQTLEWASFLAFFVAAVLFGVAAVRKWRITGRIQWFPLGLALFCFVVAMEEISWAQRVFAYRPPVYFLENNFQQEFNLHNVVLTGYRKLAVEVILLGYGVVFPLLLLYRTLRKRLQTWSIVPPSISLIPLFLVSYLMYADYAWEFTGEWVELMMGLGFLFAALPPWLVWRSHDERPSAMSQRKAVLASWVAVLVGGFLVTIASERLRGQSPELLELAQTEADALRLDMITLRGACQGKRHINKRIYSFVEKYDEDDLYEGAFAALVKQGLPEDRARYFLDPWNSPYWVQCTRDDDRRFDYVYSFGPNRRRESTEWEVLGDDVGAVFRKQGGD